MTNLSNVQFDEYGHLSNYLEWNAELAQQLAQANDVILDDNCMAILTIVRQFYIEFGYPPTTRPLIKYLMRHHDTLITNAILMQRFNTGTIARTLARLAGLPKPANCL